MWSDPEVSAVLKVSAGIHLAWVVIKGIAVVCTVIGVGLAWLAR